MNTGDFTKGIGVGIAIGTIMGVAAAVPMKKKGCKYMARRAMRTVGEVMTNVADNIGL